MIQRITIIVIFIGWLLGDSLHAQRISEVRFEPFGRAIRVHYTLSRLPFDSYVRLDLYISTNGGVDFTGPLSQVQGDIGKVESNGKKSLVWQAMDEWGTVDGDIVFELRGEVTREKVEVENLLMYNVSGSSCFGFMYGRVARWGGYLRGKTNFSFGDAPYTCDDVGVFDADLQDQYYVVDKASKRSRWGITGGVLYRPSGWLYLYGGAGYGVRRLMWHAQTFDYADRLPVGDLWAVNRSAGATGVEAECGGIVRFRNLAVSLGVNAVGFSFYELNGAVGLFF